MPCSLAVGRRPGALALARAEKAPFDRAFVDAMVPHHRSAIAMARSARAAGLSEPALVSIARSIERTQAREVRQLLAWRKAWFGSARIDPSAATDLGMSMKDMGMQHGDGDFGTAADVNSAFARMMIDHHRGAIRMARMALARATHRPLEALARQIVSAQQREIATLQRFAGNGGMHH